MFRPLLRRGAPLLRPPPRPIPLPSLVQCLAPLRTAAQNRRAPPSPSVSRSRPAQPVETPEAWRRRMEEEPSDDEAEAEVPSPSDATARRLVYAFLLIAVPSTIALQFPTKLLPPVPDPPELSHLSGKPLKLDAWLNHPYDALQLLMFRLRRGEYAAAVRKHMSFSAFDYLEVPLAGQQHSEKWRWWTWGTYMFLHGSPVHLLCCTVAMTSIFRLLVPAFGAARVVTAWALSGVGAAAITTHVEVYRHGDAVRRGEGTAIVLREVQLPTGEVAVRQVLTADPAYKAMFASNMGSSAGLMGLMSVVAIAMPQTTWGLLFLPMEVPSRTIFAGLLAFDAAGVAGVIPDLGIGHLGHLSGAAVGALLYALWLRRLPASRHLWRLRRSGGYW